MAYDRGQYTPHGGGYQGDYYDDGQSHQHAPHGPPPQQQRMRGLNRYASQPGMNSAYRQGDGGLFFPRGLEYI
jgi:hypothetical protein